MIQRQVLPRFSAPYAADGRVMNSVRVGDFKATASVLKDHLSLPSGQPSVSVSRSLCDGPMPHRITPVRLGVAIVQVVRSIIQVVAVLVAHHGLARGRRANESFGDQPVNISRLWLPVSTNGDLQTAIGINDLGENLGGASAAIRNSAAYSSQTAHHIIGSARDYPPFFGFLHTCQYGRKLALLQGIPS